MASPLWLCGRTAGAQDLGQGFTIVNGGIYVYAAKPGNSNCGIIYTGSVVSKGTSKVV